MALRYLAGKLRVPAGAALRRAEGSRGVASRAPQKVPSLAAEEEELKRILKENNALIRQLIERPLYNQNYSTQVAFYLSVGTVLGVFVGSLMLRYEYRSGGKIGKFMCGIPTN